MCHEEKQNIALSRNFCVKMIEPTSEYVWSMDKWNIIVING